MDAIAATLSAYDYTPLLLRTDTVYPLCGTDVLLVGPPALDDLDRGDPAALRACIIGIWNQLAIPEAAVLAMGGVLSALLDQLARRGKTLYDARAHELVAFATANPNGTPASLRDQQLRRNVIHGAFLALEDAGMHPVELLVPVKKPSGGAQGVPGARPCTHDEMLLLRLATRLVDNTQTIHLSGAVTALCAATATTSEAPQVLWTDHADNHLTLPGRTDPQGRRQAHIAPRVVSLDRWEAAAIEDWRHEQNQRRTPRPEESMIYSGRQCYTSNSAAVSADQQIRKALTKAGLDKTARLSAGSLRLWGAVRHATDPMTIADGAKKAGIPFDTLHRLLTPDLEATWCHDDRSAQSR